MLRTEGTVSILWRLAECLFWIGRAAASYVCLYLDYGAPLVSVQYYSIETRKNRMQALVY